ncbi:CvpA family protein [Rhodoferax saidenbachensis]|uniref:Colicin V synthesis protein n=1 Tax=Rhodoferax saidenbachensis TaxID=1484693 RepID=A0A1P8K7N0_9BURK|nr:CvpA family protein [Rhodoferax saidenbachensis]APW42004.1 colicin V synthesis protein [Rhodoferax saidenbachensis]
MPALDWIFIGVLLFSLLLGAWRGLVYEVLSLLGWIAAFVLAQWFAPDAARWLPMSGATEPIRYAAGFVLVFIATVFACSVLAFVIKKLMAAVGLAPADRVLGAVFGLLRGVIILLAVTVVVGMTPLHTADWWQEAAGPKVATVVVQGIKPVLPQEFGKYLP